MVCGTRHPAGAQGRPHGPRGHCRWERENHRRARSSGGFPSRLARAAGLERSATHRARATSAPRSARPCIVRGSVRSSAERNERDRRHRRVRRSALQRCSRERERSTSGPAAQDRRASSERWRRSPGSAGEARPAPRTTPHGPNGRLPGSARPPARHSCPARRGCRRRRRRARRYRRRSPRPPAEPRTIAVAPAPRRARARTTSNAGARDGRRHPPRCQTLPRTPCTGRPAASQA